MDCDAFATSPVGQLHPIAGHDAYLKRDYRHFAFVPRALPPTVPLAELTYKMISDADRAVGRLDAAADRLPNPSLLVRPSLYREAVSTSALEGTYAPLMDVFEADYVEEGQRTSEVIEILNYVRAAERGLELIKTKPICVTLVAELQKILVHKTRGDSYDAGQLRGGQVFIGERRTGIEKSRFVPPPPGAPLRDGMSDWEKWFNPEDSIPLLVKAALAHYQFETLHPFHDGNGRLGRLIIVLQLVDAMALKYPILNVSPFLEPRTEEYKDLLLDVSRTGAWDPWVQFFAQAIEAQARDAIVRIERLTAIRQEMIDRLRSTGARGVVLDIVEDLIGYPMITPTTAASLHHVTYPPANAAIRRLESLGFLREVTGRSYGRVYACDQVMRAVEDIDPHGGAV